MKKNFCMGDLFYYTNVTVNYIENKLHYTNEEIHYINVRIYYVN